MLDWLWPPPPSTPYSPAIHLPLTTLIAGSEMCLELVRTRAFAALLSDEVFSDVDLETVQVSGRYFIHHRILPGAL